MDMSGWSPEFLEAYKLMQQAKKVVQDLVQQLREKRHEENQKLLIVEDEEKFKTFSCSKD